MKLQEAANILGLSLEEVTTESLKQTFRKLTTSSDVEKMKDPQSKLKYAQISEAYKKLSTIMEGKDSYRGDNSHEIAAFMRMFMDMVGITENDTLPAAAMTFGMMFGSQQNSEDWSTDEEGDYDEEDDDELFDGCYPSRTPALTGEKDALGPKDDKEKESDMDRRIRTARKRADKRKKQKGKKSKEPYRSEEMIRAPRPSHGDDEDETEGGVDLTRRVLPLEEQKEALRSELLLALLDGQEDVLDRVLGLSPSDVDEEALNGLRKELPSLFPIHKCITNLAHSTDSADQLRKLAERRRNVARRLLALTDPPLDLNLYDDQGLSILHKSVACCDVAFVRLVIEAIASRDSAGLNVNSRCHRKGWAPLHYAVEAGSLDAISLLAEAGANLTATSATDKKLTPLELAKQRSKAAGARGTAQEVVDHLSALIQSHKAGGKKGREEGKGDCAAVASTAAVASGTGGESKGSDKKGKKRKETSRPANASSRRVTQPTPLTRRRIAAAQAVRRAKRARPRRYPRRPTRQQRRRQQQRPRRRSPHPAASAVQTPRILPRHSVPCKASAWPPETSWWTICWAWASPRPTVWPPSRCTARMWTAPSRGSVTVPRTG